MDREVASHLAFDLSLGARLSLTRMVGTETYETTRMGASFKGRGCLKRHLFTINTFCVRIDSGDGSGQFIPPKGFFFQAEGRFGLTG